MAKYFRDAPGVVVGLGADIERHRSLETKFRQMIGHLEAVQRPTKMDEAALHTYRHFLCQLLDSKAEVTNKIGQTK